MRAAAVQLNARADKAANLEKADRLVRRAAADGATLVVLPEKWTAIGTGDDLRAAAEPLGGEASAWAADIARELGIDLVAGSISERLDGEDKLRNTSVHYGPDGALRAPTGRSTCSTSRSGASSTASPTARIPATRPS